MSDPLAPVDPRSTSDPRSSSTPSAADLPAHPWVTPVPLAFGSRGVIRSPGRVFALCWVTLGVYALVLHFRLNAELAAFNPGIAVRPGLAVASFLVPFGGLISVLNTSERIRRTQAAVGLSGDCSPGRTFLFMLVGGSYAYQQAQLNLVWTRPDTR